MPGRPKTRSQGSVENQGPISSRTKLPKDESGGDTEVEEEVQREQSPDVFTLSQRDTTSKDVASRLAQGSTGTKSQPQPEAGPSSGIRQSMRTRYVSQAGRSSLESDEHAMKRSLSPDVFELSQNSIGSKSSSPKNVVGPRKPVTKRRRKKAEEEDSEYVQSQSESEDESAASDGTYRSRAIGTCILTSVT